jgi:hypothetical protein
MSFQQYKQTLFPYQMSLCGNFQPGSDIKRGAQLLPGAQGEVVVSFALPRNVAPGRGTRLTAINICYELLAGQFAQLTPQLSEIICQPGQPAIVSVIPITSSGFQLYPGIMYTGSSSINSPTFDNDNRCEQMCYKLCLIAGAQLGATFKIHCVEAIYDWMF